ncbi:MAG: MBL fold metallo-hydrolase [Pseudorhodobacter sp.]
MFSRPLLFTLAFLPGIAAAQDRIPSHCIALAENGYLQKARFETPVAEDEVRIRYLNHASFAMRTASDRVLVTDFTGFLGDTGLVPDVVTMNNSHRTHWTANPDTRIPHILEGWGQRHDLDLGDVRVRNVLTDARGFEQTRREGNSIFIFEMAGLCVGHLGHLHHIPDEAQYAELGRVDVLMVPVDGGYTLDLPSMMEVVRRLKSSVVLPMHWFSGASLERFLAGMEAEFDIVRLEDSQIDLSLSRLPGRPTIMVLNPEWLP